MPGRTFAQAPDMPNPISLDPHPVLPPLQAVQPFAPAWPLEEELPVPKEELPRFSKFIKEGIEECLWQLQNNQRDEQRRREWVDSREKPLRDAGIAVDVPSLIAYLRQRLAYPAHSQDIDALIVQFGSDQFAERKKPPQRSPAMVCACYRHSNRLKKILTQRLQDAD